VGELGGLSLPTGAAIKDLETSTLAETGGFTSIRLYGGLRRRDDGGILGVERGGYAGGVLGVVDPI
jgi:hypothetical protein